MARLVLAIVVAVGLACTPAWEERATQAQWNPAGGFWDLPMPSDLRIESDGTWNLEKWPGDWRSDMVAMWLAAGEDELGGKWGLSSGVFVQMSSDLDLSSLPADPAASIAPGASVYLLSIDPSSADHGKRYPIEVGFDPDSDVYAPPRLLSALAAPGFVRRPETRYALVITERVKDTTGAAIGRSKAFHDAYEDSDGDGDGRAAFKALRATLEAEGLDQDEVVAAAVFTTADPDRLLIRLSAWAEEQPLPAYSAPWALAAEQIDGAAYRLFEARIQIPRIQLGDPPFSRVAEGRIAWGDDGKPVIQRHQEMRLVLAVPNAAAPADGLALTIYAHGSGGQRRQVLDRGPQEERDDAETPPLGSGPSEWLARRGVATLGFDFPLHGARHSPPDTTGLMLYNLTGNIVGTIHNFAAASMELTFLSRLMLAARIDLGGGASTGFDPARLSAMGQSMGSTIAISWLSIDPRVKAVVLSGAGGSLAEIATSAIEPFDVQGVLQAFLQPGRPIERNHPLLQAMQNVWDLVDPVVKANHLLREPLPGVPIKHVFLPAGVTDGYFSPRAEAALAVHLGAPLVSAEVEPYLPAALRLAGVDRVTYPVNANMGGKTAAVIQYAAQNTKGHYVLFNQEGARHQYTCFLASIGSAGRARIAAPGGVDDPCP